MNRPQAPAHPAPPLRWLLWLVVVVLALALGLSEVGNPDLPLHLRTGAYALENGPPRTNVFSHLYSTRPMVDDKWLFQVVVFGVYELGGFEALSLFKAGLVLALALLLAGAASVRGRLTASAVLACGLALLAAHPRLMVRPDLLSLVFLAAVLRLFRRYLEHRRKWPLAVLFALQVVWVNSHGYFILAPLLAFTLALGVWIDERRGLAPRGAARDLLGMGGILLLLSLLNPYFLAGALYPITTLLDLWQHQDLYRSSISEFQPTFTGYPRLPYDLVVHRVLIVGLVAALISSARRVAARDLLLAGLFVAISLSLRRNVAPFAVVAAVIIAPQLAKLELSLAQRFRGGALGAVLVVSLLGLGLAAIGATGRLVPRERTVRSFGVGLARDIFPEREIDFVARHALAAQPWNPFDHGSYIVWRLWPEVRPTMDGNTSGYPAPFLAQHVEEAAGRVPPDEIRARTGADYFLVRVFDRLASRLSHEPGYAPVYLGLHLVMFVPREERWSELIAAHDLTATLAEGRVPASLEAVLEERDFYLQPLLRLAHGLTLAGHDRLAAKILERALELAPGSAEVFHLIGWTAYRLGDGTAAREALQRSLELDPDAVEVLTDRALVLLDLGDPVQARADIERALAIYPHDPEVWFRRARIAGYQGDREAERQALERCLEIEPDHLGALADLALLRRDRLEDRDGALELLHRLHRLLPAGSEREEVEAEIRELEGGS
ncbi:MAG: tetratricopeptide repeat protein [Planctomycetota bacterium]